MRLPDYDYSIAGSFFVTICARDRAALFGSLQDQRFHANDLGRVVQSCWQAIPNHFPNVTLDEWVLMPNHLHGIVVNWGDKGPTCRAPADPRSPGVAFPPVVKEAEQPNRFGPLVPNSLGSVVRAFKAAATKTARESGAWSTGTIWQRGYHERLIRTAREPASMGHRSGTALVGARHVASFDFKPDSTASESPACPYRPR